MQMPPDPDGLSQDQVMAKMATVGLLGNARTMVLYGEQTFGELSLTDTVAALADSAKRIDDGSLSSLVAMLSSQASALNTIFGELNRRAAMNLGAYPDAFERYMRLALRAQGQCRATLETLAAIKNPPLVYARQANINNGGQQQVNNAAGRAAPAPATKTISDPNGLLEASSGTWLDVGTTGSTVRGDPQMAPMGSVNRPEDRRGEG